MSYAMLNCVVKYQWKGTWSTTKVSHNVGGPMTQRTPCMAHSLWASACMLKQGPTRCVWQKFLRVQRVMQTLGPTGETPRQPCKRSNLLMEMALDWMWKYLVAEAASLLLVEDSIVDLWDSLKTSIHFNGHTVPSSCKLGSWGRWCHARYAVMSAGIWGVYVASWRSVWSCRSHASCRCLHVQQWGSSSDARVGNILPISIT